MINKTVVFAFIDFKALLPLKCTIHLMKVEQIYLQKVLKTIHFRDMYMQHYLNQITQQITFYSKYVKQKINCLFLSFKNRRNHFFFCFSLYTVWVLGSAHINDFFLLLSNGKKIITIIIILIVWVKHFFCHCVSFPLVSS